MFSIFRSMQAVKLEKEPHYFRALWIAGREAEQRSVPLVEEFLLLYGALRCSIHLRNRLFHTETNLRELIMRVSNEIELNVVSQYYDPKSQVRMGREAKSILRLSHKLAEEYKCEYPRVQHLLFALVQRNQIASILADYGITEENIRPLLSTI